LKTFFITYKKVFEILPKNFKNKFFLIQILIIFTSIIDLLGLAALIPVLVAVLDMQILDTNVYFVFLKSTFGFQDNKYFILALFLSAFLFFLARAIFLFISNWIQNKFIYAIGEDIAKKTYKYYLDLDYLKFVKKDSSKVIRELTVNPQHFSKFLVYPILLLSNEILVVVLIVLSIAFFEIKVFFLLLSTILPITFLFNGLLKKRVREYGKTQNNLTPLLYSSSTRAISGYIDVKLKSKEKTLIFDYMKVLKDLNSINIKVSVLNVMPAKIFEISMVAGFVIILLYGLFLKNSPELVLPLISIYALSGYRVIPSLSKIIPSLIMLEKHSYLFDVFKAPLFKYKNLKQTDMMKRKNQDLSAETPISIKNYLLLDDVSFKYSENGNYILKNINLKIYKGEIVGIIGRSGTGKTTIVNILAGFLKPTSGNINVDGRNVYSHLQSWMNKISYVQQSSYIERGTLATNIAFLENNIDNEKLNNVIKLASLNNLLNGSDPRKFIIDENGKNLSGGQKQRIVIARALYNDSDLIILDEATSALDNETEREINETVRLLKETGVTVLIIAHRYSTLRYTDRIIEMSDGMIKKEIKYKDILHN